MKRNDWILLAILVAIAVFAIGLAYFVRGPSITEYPEDPVSCVAAGGRWEALGLAIEPSCNMPTSDSGQVCYSMDGCEGLCMVSDPEAGSGICSNYHRVVGCWPSIYNGQIMGTICID
jgi:hypothetical protein